jgi:cytochrome c oxidase subunit 1
MVFSMLGITLLGFMVWAHHMFVSGMNPALGMAFGIATTLIALPSGVKVFNWLATLWGARIQLTSAMLFALGFVALFITGGLSGLWLACTPVDVYMHDTTSWSRTSTSSSSAARSSGSSPPATTGSRRCSGGCSTSASAALHFVGTSCWRGRVPDDAPAGTRRHAAAHRRPDGLPLAAPPRAAQRADHLVRAGARGLAGPLPRQPRLEPRARPARPAQPWRAASLEWEADSPPPHGNFARQPQVERGPYEYDPREAEEDFRPQAARISALE